jgi:hypothetical protein
MAGYVEPLTAQDAVAVTASDTTVFSPPLDAVWVGGAGNLAVKTAGGTTVTITGVLAGSIIPIACLQVRETNTTATSLTGLRYR